MPWAFQSTQAERPCCTFLGYNRCVEVANRFEINPGKDFFPALAGWTALAIGDVDATPQSSIPVIRSPITSGHQAFGVAAFTARGVAKIEAQNYRFKRKPSAHLKVLLQGWPQEDYVKIIVEKVGKSNALTNPFSKSLDAEGDAQGGPSGASDSGNRYQERQQQSQRGYDQWGSRRRERSKAISWHGQWQGWH